MSQPITLTLTLSLTELEAMILAGSLYREATECSEVSRGFGHDAIARALNDVVVDALRAAREHRAAHPEEGLEGWERQLLGV